MHVSIAFLAIDLGKDPIKMHVLAGRLVSLGLNIDRVWVTYQQNSGTFLTQPLVPNLYDILSSVELKKRCFEMCPDISRFSVNNRAGLGLNFKLP